MWKVLLFAGILCLLSFVILCLKKVDFCIIWLLLAVLFICWGGYLVYRMKNPAGFRLPGFFIFLFVLCLVTGAGAFCYVEGQIIAAMHQKIEKSPEYVIVLGAQVKKRKASKALKLRLKKAAEFLKENPGTIAILSGGQGDGEEISEAACMYEWMLEAGVDDDRLLLEDMSTTTKENLEYSAAVIERSLKLRGEQKNGKECSVGLISNNFHVYRAVKLAKKQGYTEVYGIAAPGDYKLQIHYMVREFFAILQAKIKGDI